jgi:hypothetical protein
LRAKEYVLLRLPRRNPKDLNAAVVSNEGRGFLHGQRRGTRVVSQPGSGAERGEEEIIYSYLNLWPFVGVLFALLIIFMTGGPPSHRNTAMQRHSQERGPKTR